MSPPDKFNIFAILKEVQNRPSISTSSLAGTREQKSFLKLEWKRNEWEPKKIIKTSDFLMLKPLGS